jgi:peptidyl-prolyl cis-trans isomerase D
MLLKIREKSQGVFAWAILILICVPFALWGIQNYMGGGTEEAVATVGDKEFFQQDINRAYSQYANQASKNIDESMLKKQALDKLIQDEVLFQHVKAEGLAITDDSARAFIKGLEYFQTDGKFDNDKYKSLLAAQRMSAGEFVARIKKALVMDQFQKAVIESSFSTQADIDGFFKIQNQTRDVEMLSIALPTDMEEPSTEEIDAYYQENSQQFLTEEQVSIEYVELALDDLAKQVEPTSEQLQEYYDDNKDRYTTKERRKISHILFSFTKDTDDDAKQLERANNAKLALATKEFSALAAEVSDDKMTAKKGGDLGLFNIGVMEKAFEDVASTLKLDEVSEPVKSAFGYHLIKVTELVAGDVKSFDKVKDDVVSAYQKVAAETTFYELGESLTELSYENPDSLAVVSDELGMTIKKTDFFGRNMSSSTDQSDVTLQQNVVNAAFSEDVLKGNNSQPIEIGTDKLVVLRMIEHKPSDVKGLDEVKSLITASILKDKAKKIVQDKASDIKSSLVSGKTMQEMATAHGLEVKKIMALTRADKDMAWQVKQAIFKAAKPTAEKPTVVTIDEPTGAQTVISVIAVAEGEVSEEDKLKKKLMEGNMEKAFGELELGSILSSLRQNTSVTFKAATESN